MAKNYSATAGGMLDDLKARLGFGGRDDDDYQDDYDDYEDDYDEYDDYEDDYDDRDVSSSRRSSSRSSYSSDRSYDRRGDSGPRLVSIDDVKESTRIPDRLNRDPLARETRESARQYGSRSVIDETVPPVSSPAHNAALRDSQRSSSDGYNSLFEPTRSTEPIGTPRSYDPYEAYSTGTTGTHAPMRSLTVIKPTVYGDVERVSKAVKSGDVVVLVMRNTPDDLSKRILDFSFGVASALDANVECPGEKVFAIARGNALSEDEKRRLRNQGAL